MNEFEQPLDETPPLSQPTPVEDNDKPGWGTKWLQASKRWAKEANLSYLSNPAARRDFVVQFRGSRSAWLFAAYLLIMGFVALLQYWQLTNARLGLAETQSRLIDFYRAILYVLGVAITLIPPAMAATAIVAEKQRKSLDLVFATPVPPKVYLIGKIIAVYRYTWILLALSLPFTAISVLLGGASWLDVFGAYLMLSIQGLVLTSIGLLFSAITEKAVPALLYTVGAIGAYVYGTAALAELTAFRANGVSGRSFFDLFNPFFVFEGLGSTTTIAGVPIPNFLIAGGACLLMTRMLLAMAGAALVPPRPKERARLRLSGMAAQALFVGSVCLGVAQGQAVAGNFGLSWAPVVLLLTMPLVLFVPFLSCYGFDGEQNARPSGLISWSKTLIGTPAGALTYIWALVASSLFGAAAGVWLGGGRITGGEMVAGALYGAAFWSFFWAMGRLASSFLLGLKASRTLQFMSFVAVVGAPLPFFAMVNGNEGDFWRLFPFNLYILSPMFAMNDKTAILLVWAVALGLLSALVAWWSEVNLRHRLAMRGAGLGQIQRATGAFQDNVRG